MSLVGPTPASQYLISTPGQDGPPVSNYSNFTLRPDQLEAAIAQTVANLIWMGKGSYWYAQLCYHSHCVINSAGRIGYNAGIQPGEGMAIAKEEMTLLRLNVSIDGFPFASD
jgi:hypothetical protein